MQTTERTVAGLAGDLVRAAWAGDWPALALVCQAALGLGLDRQDLGGETALAYALEDVLTCAETEDWPGFADAAEYLAGLAGR